MFKREEAIAVPLIVIVIVVLVIILGLGSALYHRYSRNVNTEDNIVSERSDFEEIEESAVITDEDIKKMDETKEIVYTGYQDTSGQNRYEFPVINLDYDSVRYINNQIKKYYDKLESAIGSNIVKLFYQYYRNDNILSVLLIEEGYSSVIRNHTIFHVDINTGNLLDETAILAYRNYGSDDVYERAEGILDNRKNELIEGNPEYKDQINSQHEKTIQEMKKSSYFVLGQAQHLLYLDENSHLHMIAKVYNAIAGAETSIADINLNAGTIIFGSGELTYGY